MFGPLPAVRLCNEDIGLRLAVIGTITKRGILWKKIRSTGWSKEAGGCHAINLDMELVDGRLGNLS